MTARFPGSHTMNFATSRGIYSLYPEHVWQKRYIRLRCDSELRLDENVEFSKRGYVPFSHEESFNEYFCLRVVGDVKTHFIPFCKGRDDSYLQRHCFSLLRLRSLLQR